MKSHDMKFKITIFLFILCLTWLLWFSYLGFSNAIEHIKEYAEISVTMLFASIFAGGTSMGGGAVAFPVFTKILHIPPYDAKMFSLAIQSVGMTSASIVILLMKAKIEWRIVLWGSIGGMFGIAISIVFLALIVPSVYVKLAFTALLSSFAIVLLMQKYKCSNTTNMALPIFAQKEISLILFAGIMGGMVSGIVGNGIDIIIFSIMVLLFKMDNKISTFTSVILMAINAFMGFLLHLFLIDDFSNTVSNYWLASIPIVVLGAPIGAIICQSLSKDNITNVLIFLISLELASSLLIIDLTNILRLYFLVFLFFSFYINYLMYRSNKYNIAS